MKMQEGVSKQWVNRFDVVDPETQLRELAGLETEMSPVTKVLVGLSKAVETLTSRWFGR
jgi:hypothetical protein